MSADDIIGIYQKKKVLLNTHLEIDIFSEKDVRWGEDINSDRWD